VDRAWAAVFGVFLLGLTAGMLVGRGLSETRHRALAAVFFVLGLVLLAGGFGWWRWA
jgi:hypothetical protein